MMFGGNNKEEEIEPSDRTALHKKKGSTTTSSTTNKADVKSRRSRRMRNHNNERRSTATTTSSSSSSSSTTNRKTVGRRSRKKRNRGGYEEEEEDDNRNDDDRDKDEMESISEIPGAHRTGGGDSGSSGSFPTNGHHVDAEAINQEEEDSNHHDYEKHKDPLVVAELAETPDIVVGTVIRSIPVWKKLLLVLLLLIVITAIVVPIILLTGSSESIPNSQSMEPSLSPKPSSASSTSPSISYIPTTAPSQILQRGETYLTDFFPEGQQQPNTELYRQALEWVTMNDSGLLSSSDPTESFFFERFVLVLFYLATNGDNWRFQNLWLSNTSICGWFGIGCTEDGKVETMDLCTSPIFNINSILPKTPKDRRLTSLLTSYATKTHTKTKKNKTITVGLGNSNNLSGTIPVEIGSLTALSRLDLGSYSTSLCRSPDQPIIHCHRFLQSKHQQFLGVNDLRGSIPTELGRLTALRKLNLGRF